jgi:transcriptional regulator with XRE-family HTH domain
MTEGRSPARARAVGDRLCDARVRKGMSIEELATAAGLDPAFCARVEAGTAELDRLTMDVLYDVTAALGTTPAEVLGGLG